MSPGALSTAPLVDEDLAADAGLLTAGSRAATPELSVLDEADGAVVLAAGQRRYHLGGCRRVAYRTVVRTSIAAAEARGLQPCWICKPDVALATDAAAETRVDGWRARNLVATWRRAELPSRLLWAAVCLMMVGLASAVVGWRGAAHTPYLQEQIPYLVSGGLVGMALIVIGSALYLAALTARNAALARDANGELLLELVELRDRVAAALGSVPFDPPPIWVATAAGSRAHRPTCKLVAGRVGLVALGSEPGRYDVCRLCGTPGS